MKEIHGNAYDPDIIRCPWAFDAALRDQAPVFHDEHNQIYLISSYELIDQVIHDPERFSSRYMEKMVAKEPLPPEVMAIYAKGHPIVDALLVTDGAQHDRHRRIITKAFSRQRLNELAPLFEERVASLFERVRPHGRMAFRKDIADAVPLIMTQYQLRIPDEEMPQVLEWSHILATSFGGAAKSLDRLKYEAEHILEFQRYFERRIRTEMERIAATGQGERDDDLLTLLASAVLAPDDPMDMVEAISFLFNLLPATHDTTSASLTACMHRFVENPDAQARAAADPEYIKRFIEEALRHESPIRAFWRRTTTDVTLGGVNIPAASWLLLRIGSANRDDAVYSEAERFDPDRRMAKPHLSFSTGIHTCAGRMYARHIIGVVMRHLSGAAQDFRFIPGENDFDHEVNILASPYKELMISFS